MMSFVLDSKGLQTWSKVDHMQPRMWTVIQQPTAQKTTANIKKSSRRKTIRPLK